MDTNSQGATLPGSDLRKGFSLTDPSTYMTSLPDWQGVTRFVGGGIREADAVIYDGFHSIVDPVIKAPAALEDYAVKTIESGYESAAARVSGAFSAVGNAAGGILSPLSSGLKWGIAISVVGIAIYAFLLASPFLPKPGGSR